MSDAPSRVPPSQWPLRCRACREDLTGALLQGEIVVCPSCGKGNRISPEQDPAQSQRIVLVAIAVCSVFALIALVLYLLFTNAPPPPA